jgi:HK97 gp10 family phage protein
MPQGFSLEISGIQQLAGYVSQLASTIKQQIIIQLTSIFEQSTNRMKSDCPVRTGFLKNSITLNKSAEGSILVQINITAKYAGFVNFGTIHMRPRPFASNGYNFILAEMNRLAIGAR